MGMFMSNLKTLSLLMAMVVIIIGALAFVTVKITYNAKEDWTEMKAVKARCENMYQVKCILVIVPETIDLNKCIQHITYRPGI